MDYLIYGLLSGSILLLGAVGFYLIRKVENYLDIGYGQYLTVGAYLAWYCYGVIKLPLVVAVIIAVAATSVLALLMAKLFYHPIRSYGSVMLLFTSVGIAYIIHGTIEAVFGVNAKNFTLPRPKVFNLGAESMITSTEIIIMLIALACAVGIHLILTKTKIGKAIRAMASNFELAMVRGIDTTKMSSYVHLMAGALGGLAGVLIGIKGTIYVDMGWVQVLIILAAVILGGLSGSVYGVMLGAIIVGMGMELSVIFLPAAYRPAVAFLIIIVALFLKPEGLFTKRGSAK